AQRRVRGDDAGKLIAECLEVEGAAAAAATAEDVERGEQVVTAQAIPAAVPAALLVVDRGHQAEALALRQRLDVLRVVARAGESAQLLLVARHEPHGQPELGAVRGEQARGLDRKSTRLNSSHQIISYAVFCL